MVSSQINQFCKFEFYIPKRKTVEKLSRENSRAREQEDNVLQVFDAQIVDQPDKETEKRESPKT